MDSLKRRAPKTTIPLHTLGNLLSRLPAKSLLRFRCVSKAWYSFIRHKKFIELHRWRSLSRSAATGLVVCFKHSSSKLYVTRTDYQCRPTRDSISSLAHDRFSQIINGLVCLIGNSRCNYRVFVCNICTHEFLPIPASNSKLINPAASIIRPSYLFGFDPVTNAYKILNICTITTPLGLFSYEFEVYTLGTDSWTRIQPPEYEFSSPFYAHDDSICVNGVVFWIQNREDYRTKSLEWFDVKDEKFNRIRFPKAASSGPSNLMQFHGRLAVTMWPGKCTDGSFLIKLWILDNPHHPAWTLETITIPETLTAFSYPYPIGTIRSGELMLVDNVLTGTSRLLFYDMHTKTCRGSVLYTRFLQLARDPIATKRWSRFSHNQFKELHGIDMLHFSVTEYVENIVPLKTRIH